VDSINGLLIPAEAICRSTAERPAALARPAAGTGSGRHTTDHWLASAPAAPENTAGRQKRLHGRL
jgi:hypothetical protein